MNTAGAKLLTAAEFLLLPDDGKRRSLVRGEVVEGTPVAGDHGVIAALFVRYLDRWAEERDAGVVGISAGFVLARNPDTVRGPVVSLVRAAHIPAAGLPAGF